MIFILLFKFCAISTPDWFGTDIFAFFNFYTKTWFFIKIRIFIKYKFWKDFQPNEQKCDVKTHAHKRDCRRFLNGFRAEHLKVACASLGFRSSTLQFSFRLTRSDGILVHKNTHMCFSARFRCYLKNIFCAWFRRYFGIIKWMI